VIRAVIFDMGGTLIDFNPRRLPWLEWERIGLNAVGRWLAGCGYGIPADALASRFLDVLPARWAEATRGGANLRLAEALDDALRACGIALSPAELDEAVAQYIAPIDDEVAVYPDAVETLDQLRERGYAIGLISNTMWPSVYHERQLERFGILSRLDHRVFSADAGAWKPQPGVFRLSLEALNVAPHQAVYVGDIPEHDVRGAQDAGLRAVYRRHPDRSLDGVRPDAEIDCLSELPEIVAGW